jgi:RHS repeat-associated protein
MAEISSKAAGKLQNKNKYNGKELQSQEFSDGSGLEEYDYGARFFEPQTGRWNQVDPSANKYYALSPFSYCANNPVSAIDPNGKEIIVTNGYEQPSGKILTDQFKNIFGNKVTANIDAIGRLTFKSKGHLSGKEKILFNKLNAMATSPNQMSITLNDGAGGFDRYDNAMIYINDMAKLSLDLNQGRSMGAWYLHVLAEQWHKQVDLELPQVTPDQTYSNPAEVEKNDYGFSESHLEGLYAEYELNGLIISNEGNVENGWYQLDFSNPKGEYNQSIKYITTGEERTIVRVILTAIDRDKQNEKERKRAENQEKEMRKIIDERQLDRNIIH